MHGELRKKYEQILRDLGSGCCTILPLPVDLDEEEPLTSDRIAREWYTDGAGDA